MTFEEFERVLIKEKIPRKWVSLNEGYKAPVMLIGKSLYYGKSGCTNFLKDISYDFILERLQEYKKEVDFETSDLRAKVTGIDIGIIHQDHIKEYGDVFLVERTSFNGNQDSALLKAGYQPEYYDQYMGHWMYQKACGDEIFTSVTICLEIKTQDYEREQFGFQDNVLSSKLTLPFSRLSKELREKIVRYIKEKKTQTVSAEDDIFGEIINEYGFEYIIQEENTRLQFLDEVYQKILGYEIRRQEFLEQYSEEELMEVYRSIKTENIFSTANTWFSRASLIEKRRFQEAKEKLQERMRMEGETVI